MLKTEVELVWKKVVRLLEISRKVLDFISPQNSGHPVIKQISINLAFTASLSILFVHVFVLFVYRCVSSFRKIN